MTDKPKGIGPIPPQLEGLDPDGFLLQVRRMLIDLQAGRIAGLSSTSAAATGVVPVAGPPGPPGPPAAYVPDLTPPPTPSGVVVSAGLDFVFIQTDAPTFTMGHGYNRTLVYGATYAGTGPLPTFSSAVLVHEFVGQVGSFGSEPATQWHIWLKWRTNDSELSVSPDGGANGRQVTTGQDISQLLEALAGSITASELQAALAARIDLVDASSAVIGSVNQRIASGDAAVASTVTTLSATVAGNTAAIAAETAARSSADGHMSATYNVRVALTQDGRTVQGGFGIMGTSGGTAGPTIDFGVLANRFYIGAPTGSTGVGDVQPFTVQTTDSVVNGVTIPKGVYMDAAYIKNVQAITARLGTLWVTDAMMANVSATKITAGAIAVGEYIQSSDFVTGVSGWRWGGNTGEVGSTYIRGLLTASQIDTRGLDIRDASNNIVFSSGTHKQYRAVARGFDSSTHPVDAGLYDAVTGSLLSGPARSYVVNVFDRTTGTLLSGNLYDVYLNAANAATMAAALNALGSNRIVLIRSYDEPQDNRTANGLAAAIKRCGGTAAVFEATKFKDRSAYILIGIPGCGEGNAFYEGYAGTIDSDPNAWLDVAFSIVSGNVLIGSQGSRLFEINSSNVSTYIANAAIGNAQIGGDIQSTIYTPGSAGWIIKRDGTAEFDAVHIRGQLTTGQIGSNAVVRPGFNVNNLGGSIGAAIVNDAGATRTLWSTVASVSLPVDGGRPVLVTFNVTLHNDTSALVRRFTYRISNSASGEIIDDPYMSGIPAGVRSHQVSYSVAHVPASAGTTTYLLEMFSVDGAGTVFAASNTAIAQELRAST